MATSQAGSFDAGRANAMISMGLLPVAPRQAIMPLLEQVKARAALMPLVREQLDREYSYDGTHPVRQETINRQEMLPRYAESFKDAFIPGYGSGKDAADASDAFSEGRYGSAAFSGAMSALDFVPVLGAGIGAVRAGARGAEAANEARKGIRAYHGSPHDFDKFSMDKIGTGEGAQAYGHGLYFAENEGVARGYRDALSGRIDVQPVSIDGVRYSPPSDQHQRVAAIIAKDGRRGAMQVFRDLRDQDLLDPDQEAVWREVLGETKGRDVRPEQGGRMYEVNINANPEDFLDWDAPLSEQGERVRSVMLDAPNRERQAILDMLPEADGRMSHDDYLFNYGAQLDAAARLRTDPGMTGEQVVRNVGELRMRDAGIPGIRYYDQGSRAGGEGTRNYVVFDENLIDIVRKYGLAGLMLSGAGASMVGDYSIDPEQM